MSDSQTNFTLTDPAIEPIDLNRMDEFLFSAMLRASIHLGGSHTPLQLSRMVRKSLLKLSLEKDLTFDLAYAKEFTPVSKLSPLALQIYENAYRLHRPDRPERPLPRFHPNADTGRGPLNRAV